MANSEIYYHFFSNLVKRADRTQFKLFANIYIPESDNSWPAA